VDIFLNYLIQFCLNSTINFAPFNSTHYVVLYPQNGDRIVTIDSVTSFHPMYWYQFRSGVLSYGLWFDFESWCTLYVYGKVLKANICDDNFQDGNRYQRGQMSSHEAVDAFDLPPSRLMRCYSRLDPCDFQYFTLS